jgi:hypothetical protein
MTDPYAALGLTRNAFVCDDPRALPDGLWLDHGLQGAPEPAARTALQVIGVRGAGKTSLLSRWHASTGGVYRWVPPAMARWRPLPCAPICYWDEADRAPQIILTLSLLRARRVGATVVLGTHTDLSRQIRRAGLDARTLTLPAPGSDSVMQWATLRIAAVRISGAASPGLTLDEATAARIAASAGGSWRTVGDQLHAWAADASRTGAPVESLV